MSPGVSLIPIRVWLETCWSRLQRSPHAGPGCEQFELTLVQPTNQIDSITSIKSTVFSQTSSIYSWIFKFLCSCRRIVAFQAFANDKTAANTKRWSCPLRLFSVPWICRHFVTQSSCAEWLFYLIFWIRLCARFVIEKHLTKPVCSQRSFAILRCSCALPVGKLQVLVLRQHLPKVTLELIWISYFYYFFHQRFRINISDSELLCGTSSASERCDGKSFLLESTV